MTADDLTPAHPQPASDSNAFLDAVAADPKLAAEISAAVDATFAAALAGAAKASALASNVRTLRSDTVRYLMRLFNAQSTAGRTFRRGLCVALVTLSAVAATGVAARADAAPANTSPASLEWLVRMNAWRVMSGLTPVVENSTWSQQGAEHGCYMLKNGITHYQNPALPGYTPGGAEAGKSGNVATTWGPNPITDSEFVDWWMSAPFHAIGMLRESLQTSGYGRCDIGDGKGATVDVIRGINYSVPDNTEPILFPGRDTTSHLYRFRAETPDPVQLCGWDGSAGLPLIAMMPNEFTSASASLVGPSGNVEVCALHANNTSDETAIRVMSFDDAVVVVPRDFLTDGRYTATVATNGGDVTWSFAIARDDVTAMPTEYGDTVADVDGANSKFTPVAPFRLVDSRINKGTHRLKGGESREIVVSRDPDVTAVSANFTVDRPSSAGFLTVYNCTPTRPEASTLNYSDRAAAAQALVGLKDGKLCVYSHVDTDLIIDVNGFFGSAGTLKFNTLEPVRLHDSRSTARPLKPNVRQVIQVTGRAGVQADAQAVALNVTAVNGDRAGFITLWSCDTQQRPEVSSTNFIAGEVRANSAIVPLSPDGKICVESIADVPFVLDVSGYFAVSASTGFTPVASLRLLDTRSSNVQLSQWFLGSKVRGFEPGFEPVSIDIAGVRGIPANAKAVSVSVVAVSPERDGFITLWPCGAAAPVVSNLNYAAGSAATANGALVKLSADGKLCVMSQANSHLVVDITGIYQ